MTADIAKQRYTSSYDWIGGSDDNAYTSTRATEWNKWHGGDGDDYLKSSSDTHYNSGNARDIIVGGTGDDRITGGSGNDTLLGGAGNDTLFGSEGYDTLTDGTGADSFVLTLANPQNNNERISSLDRILDFNSADGDRVRIETFDGTENSLGDLGLSVADNGSHANLIFDEQVVMTINHIDHTLITDANFASYFEVV